MLVGTKPVISLTLDAVTPPVASDTLTLRKQRKLARPLYVRPGTLSSSSGAVTNGSRKIVTQPGRVLNAPGMVDGFYLNFVVMVRRCCRTFREHLYLEGGT